jgi:hypothetical protein
VVLYGIPSLHSFAFESIAHQNNDFMCTRFPSFHGKTPPAVLLIRVFVVAFVSLAFVSCQKGDAGATGPAGPAGTANVIYSNWFTPASYTKDTVFGTYGFYHDEAAASITQGVLDSGVVVTFGKLDGYVTLVWPTNQVEALPIVITYMDGSSPNIDTWSALLTPGNLRIQLQSSLNAYGSISNAHQFRYVVIPGASKATATSVKPGLKSGNGGLPDVSSLNEVRRNFRQMGYSEICRRLNIPE